MLINKLLAGAVKLWLKSQISELEDLQLKIYGRDREILKGYIPEVFVGTKKAVYQQLHLSQAEIKGTNIKINLTQLKQKKPLQLLEPIEVQINTFLLAIDAQKSLTSSLLQAALSDIALRILVERPEIMASPSAYQWQKIYFADSIIIFAGVIRQESGDIPLKITTQLELKDANSLLLLPLEISTTKLLELNKETIVFDLGEQTAIAELEITPEKLALTGKITIYP